MLVKDPTSIKKIELGWLGKNRPKFPLIVVDLEIVEARAPC